jgi:uncharacterized protein (DUF305 family)
VVAVLLAGAGGSYLWLREEVPAQTSPEVGFARDMYVHHAQAVNMSLLIRNTVADKALNTLTHEIITGQAEQQGILLGWLDSRDVPAPDDSWQSMAWMTTPTGGHGTSHGTGQGTGHGNDQHGQSGQGSSGDEMAAMPGMATDAQLAQLSKARGAEREVLFLKLMLAHHRGGVDMAKAFLARSDEPQLVELATGIVTSQQREIDIITGLLADRGATT